MNDLAPNLLAVRLLWLTSVLTYFHYVLGYNVPLQRQTGTFCPSDGIQPNLRSRR